MLKLSTNVSAPFLIYAVSSSTDLNHKFLIEELNLFLFFLCGGKNKFEKFKNMIDINKNYNESNLETMAKMPDCFIDLTVTSPPYDNLRDYKGYSFDFENVAKELFRVTKEGGVVVWVVGDATVKGSESGTSFRQALYFMSCGFNLHDTMIYAKNNPVPLTHNRYEQKFEYMFVFSKGKPKVFNPIKIKTKEFGKLKTRGRINEEGRKYDNNAFRIGQNTVVKSEKIKCNIWEYSIGSTASSKDRLAFKHPAIFPEQLANDHIFSWCNEGDLVYDCFMGSGTTAKMAIINKRNWIGSEISKEYCDIIEQRINTNGFEKTEVRGQKIFNYGLYSDNLD